MKKQMLMVTVFMGLVAVGAYAGGGLYVLPLNDQGPKGATHVVKITQADLTEAVSNTAQTITTLFPVAAKQGVECIAAVLKTAFVDSTEAALASVTLTVGDGTDADLFLTSMELDSYGTEVFLKYGRTQAGVATTIYAAPVTTGTCTNAYSVMVDGSYGKKLYTTADTVDFVFTPAGGVHGLVDLTAGEVWIYFRVWDGSRD